MKPPPLRKFFLTKDVLPEASLDLLEILICHTYYSPSPVDAVYNGIRFDFISPSQMIPIEDFLIVAWRNKDETTTI